MYPCGYTLGVRTVLKTDYFSKWLDRLRDLKARAKVLARVERFASGNPGDVQALGGGLSEMRIPYGPGYRVYFTEKSGTLVILIAGGDKRTQPADIRHARQILKNIKL
jgi:putative addiction module killer protein